MTFSILTGLSELAGKYDAVILDLWGVIHDGEKPTPGALRCMAEMRAIGWPLVLLSNAPRSLASVRKQVAGFGIPPDSYDEVVTSGDLARTALARRDDPWHARLGRRFYHLGPERDWGLLDGLDYEVVQTPERAHFILNTGLFDDETETAADYAGLLDLAHRKHLPMICANPDRYVYRGHKRLPCAGAVAEAYHAIGGDCAYHGKPLPAAYRACFAKMRGVEPRRVLAVGDSLTTDIAGANAAGIDSVLVLAGLHAEEFGARPGATLDLVAVEAAAVRFGARPTAVIPEFQW
jgi:HAD superfamily hydrolase (TIGR01459 family)